MPRLIFASGAQSISSGYNSTAFVMTDVLALAAGARHSIALKRDGTVWAWWLNASGQLGINSSVGQTHVPTQLQLTCVTHISSGENHGMALADGVACARGLNDECQLGIGSRSNARAPVALRSGVVDMDGGGFQSIFTLADGSVWRAGNMASVRVCEPASTLMQAVPRQVRGNADGGPGRP